MTVKLSIAIASHLSDAQMEMTIPSLQDQARQRLNLVKMIVNRHDDVSEYVNTDVLDGYWQECQERYGKKEE